MSIRMLALLAVTSCTPSPPEEVAPEPYQPGPSMQLTAEDLATLVEGRSCPDIRGAAQLFDSAGRVFVQIPPRFPFDPNREAHISVGHDQRFTPELSPCELVGAGWVTAVYSLWEGELTLTELDASTRRIELDGALLHHSGSALRPDDPPEWAGPFDDVWIEHLVVEVPIGELGPLVWPEAQ